MPHLYQGGSYSVGANGSLEVQLVWPDGWFGLNRGPVLFRAIPVPPRNGFIFKPLWVTEYGMTANTFVFKNSYGYCCKVRNDNPVAVEFFLELLTFDDIGPTYWPPNLWKGQAKESDIMEQMTQRQVKVTLITDNAGKIVGTAIHDGSGPDGAEPRLAPGPDQMVHVIDLPKELQGIQDADELHTKLESHLKQGASI
jgi:hypothetical protein